MKLVLAITFALASFSGISVQSTSNQGGIPNPISYHSRLSKGQCQVVYPKTSVKRIPDSTQEECANVVNKYSPIRQIAEFDHESQECVITTENDFKVENLGRSDSTEKCTDMAKKFFEANGISPFLDIPTWHQGTTSKFGPQSDKYEAAIETCKARITPGFDPILKYDKRVKEIESLKNKIFDRTLGATKRGQNMIWDYTMNDGIGFRIILDTIAAPGLSKVFAECLKSELQATGLRTQDGGLTWFMYGKINVPSLNIYNPDPENSVVEYQMWPLATGTWMLWQHDRFYKLPEHLKEGARRTYVKSLQMAAMCMDNPEFAAEELPVIKSKEGLEKWLTSNCNNFLIYKHKVAQAKAEFEASKKGKPFKEKKYEAKTENFDLAHPSVEPPIEPLDLVGIVWEKIEKTRISTEEQ